MTTHSQRALILYRRRRFINHLLTYLLTYLTGKLLKIDGYMLRGVWQALNCLFIRATLCVIATGASPGKTKNEGRCK